MTLLFFATHYWLLYKTDADDEIKYYRLSKNTKRHQENGPTNYREYKPKRTGINWNKGDIDQKWFTDNGEPLFPDVTNGKKPWKYS